MLKDSAVNNMSHKRTLPEVRPAQSTASGSSSSNSSTSMPLVSLWEQQKDSKRPRMGEYREPHMDSDDENESDDNVARRRSNSTSLADDEVGRLTLCRSDDSDTTTQDETRRTPQRTSSGQLRWILRRESKSPSFSSVITEVSELEVASVLGGDSSSDVTATRRHRHRNNKSSSSSSRPPIDTLVRNMETWSLTHIRALRRNNLYDGVTETTASSVAAVAEERANYRQSVQAARRDVMRVFRRGSSSLSSNFSVDSGTNNNNNNNHHSSSVPSSTDSLSARASSTASLSSLKTV